MNTRGKIKVINKKRIREIKMQGICSIRSFKHRVKMIYLMLQKETALHIIKMKEMEVQWEYMRTNIKAII